MDGLKGQMDGLRWKWKKIGENFAHVAGEDEAAGIIPSGSDPLPGCCSRCSSGSSRLSRSEHNSRSSLVLHSSDTGDVLSEGSVVSDRAWQLDELSGRWFSLVWRDSMILSLCCSSLLNLRAHRNQQLQVTDR